jgi:hypothetical protein
MAKGQMTYLQLTNGVLRRLGKSQTTSGAFAASTGDEWPALAKDFLNEAQREMAKEHDWSTLYTSGTFTTSSRTYDLSSTFSTFGREIDLVDTTNQRRLTPVPLRVLDEMDPLLTTTGIPTYYSIHYPNLVFNWTPTSTAYRLRYLQRATDLSAYGDTSILPEYCDVALIWWTVWQLAASREDSQDGGERARDIYEKSLARAIGQDRRRMDITWEMRPAFPLWNGSGRGALNFGAHYPAV